MLVSKKAKVFQPTPPTNKPPTGDTAAVNFAPSPDVVAQLKKKGLLRQFTEVPARNLVVVHNPPASVLYEEALKYEPGAYISSTGALCTLSGPRTGRSPTEKRIVDEPSSSESVWWGPVNTKLTPHSFIENRERAVDYLGTRGRLYIIDAYAGWDERFRVKFRLVTEKPSQALFLQIMLLRPSLDQLANFGEPDFYIWAASDFVVNLKTPGNTTLCNVSINFAERELVVIGSEYTGEIKKGVFTIMHYLMPKANVLSLHSSCNEGKQGDTTLFFGLSGTGKTTLSADPTRLLIGDDEHCWSSDGGVFNIEAGCYAKCANLSPKNEPEIFAAMRYGTVLENVVLDARTREADYFDLRVTENSRGAYPIEYMPNAKIPCVGRHPSNILFLTCDAFGVIPPVSRLTPSQAAYHFLSGYTAKIAGTETGIKKPQATFSSCFGQPFLVLHPAVYGKMLAELAIKHKTKVWLVNTGWAGGAYGEGKRMPIQVSRAIIDAIHSGALDPESGCPYQNFEIFNLAIPTKCPNVPQKFLHP